MSCECDIKREQRVVCSAIKSKVSGRIICGARHFDKIMLSQITHSENKAEWKEVEQGFIDQFGTFLSRKEAFEIANNAGQIIRRFGEDKGVLYSENLY